MICLYDSSSTDFTSNGLGLLIDALSCVVTEERNGKFEVELEYPITGKRYSEIRLHRIITVKPNPYDEPQPFRIYSISKPIGGIVTVCAAHISYDMSGIPVKAFEAYTAAASFENLKRWAVIPCPFDFSVVGQLESDPDPYVVLTINEPTSMRALLSEILSAFGGEYRFDGYSVYLSQNRGIDRGVVIRYGKNMTDLSQDEDAGEMYTGIYPYWHSEDSENGDIFIELSGDKYIESDGNFGYRKILPVDLTEYLEDPPSESELRAKALEYMDVNRIGIPSVSLKVSFIQLSLSDEYKDYTMLETVRLCDIVTVIHEDLGVSTKAQCIVTKYNALTDRYDEIEIGDVQQTLVKTVIQNKSWWRGVDERTTETETKVNDVIPRITEAETKVTEIQNEIGTNLARTIKGGIEQEINDTDGLIRLFVESFGATGSAEASAQIIAAINEYDARLKLSAAYNNADLNETIEAILELIADANESIAAIRADKIKLDGETYFVAKYRDGGQDYEFGVIKTIDNGSDAMNQSRFAILFSSLGRGMWGSSAYPVALKLESAGNMSLESGHGMYASANKYITLAAGDNTRIRATKPFSEIPTSGDGIPAATDYVFCTDGIYYNGQKLSGGGGGGTAVFG